MKWVIVALALAGCALAMAARAVPGRGVPALAAVLFGLAGVALAVEGTLKGRQVADNTIRRSTFHGPAARWASLPIGLLGLAIVVMAIAYWQHAERTVLGTIVRRPGLALLPLGIAWAAAGVAARYGARVSPDPDSPFVHTWGSRAGATFGAMVGVLVAAVGAFELVNPEAFDELVRAARGAFERWALGSALKP